MLQIFSITSDQAIPQMTITHHVIGELVNTRGIKTDGKFTKSKYIKGVLVGEIPIKDAIKPYVHLEHDSKESRVLVPTETRNGQLFVDKKVMEPQIESAKNMAKEWIKIKAEVKKAQNKAKSDRMKREYAEATNKVRELKPFEITVGKVIHKIPAEGKIVWAKDDSLLSELSGARPYRVMPETANRDHTGYVRTDPKNNSQPELTFKTKEQAQRYADKLNRAIDKANKTATKVEKTNKTSTKVDKPDSKGSRTKPSELKPFQVTMGNKIHLIPTDGKIVVSPILDPIGRYPYRIETIGASDISIRTIQGNSQPVLKFISQEQAQRYADKLNRAIERANKPPSPKKAKAVITKKTELKPLETSVDASSPIQTDLFGNNEVLPNPKLTSPQNIDQKDIKNTVFSKEMKAHVNNVLNEAEKQLKKKQPEDFRKYNRLKNEKDILNGKFKYIPEEYRSNQTQLNGYGVKELNREKKRLIAIESDKPNDSGWVLYDPIKEAKTTKSKINELLVADGKSPQFKPNETDGKKYYDDNISKYTRPTLNEKGKKALAEVTKQLNSLPFHETPTVQIDLSRYGGGILEVNKSQEAFNEIRKNINNAPETVSSITPNPLKNIPYGKRKEWNSALKSGQIDQATYDLLVNTTPKPVKINKGLTAAKIALDSGKKTAKALSPTQRN
jgi:hypothetical protein